MGVLACDRSGCENVMCDRYSNTYGYICNSCFDELGNKPFIDIDVFIGHRRDYLTNSTRDWESEIDAEFHLER